MLVLNKDIHEFDNIESIKDIFKNKKDKYIEELENELTTMRLRYSRLNKRYKASLKEKEKLKKELKEYETT